MRAQPTIECKICGATSRHLCDTPNECGEIRVIHTYRCSKCGLVFVGNSITDEQLGAAYAELDMAKYYEEVGQTTERKFQTALANLRQLQIGAQSSVIDIGTGRGDFLLFLKKAGFQRLSGHEIPGEDTNALVENEISVFQDYDCASIPSSSFEAAVMLDVMEHVPDPRKLLRAVFRILKPGGIVYFHTPSVTFIDRVMHGLQRVPGASKVGKMWQRGRTSIFHLQNYTRISLELILQQSEFQTPSIVRVNELSWPIRRYAKVYLCDKQGLPEFISYLVAPLLYPVLATALLNPNKAIVAATKSAT